MQVWKTRIYRNSDKLREKKRSHVLGENPVPHRLEKSKQALQHSVVPGGLRPHSMEVVSAIPES